MDFYYKPPKKAQSPTLLNANCFVLVLFVLFMLFSSLVDAKEEPPKIGNFALETYLAPGAFISFGQNIVNKGEWVGYVSADDYVGKHQYLIDIVPSLLYGITENTSLYLQLPFTPKYKELDEHSSGLEDAVAQFEYAFMNKTTCEYEDLATVVMASIFPTGCDNKYPPTGTGDMSYFLGVTYSRTFVDWLWLTSFGVNLRSSHRRTRYGNLFLYQVGIGKNICYTQSEWIVNWLLELDGTYAQKNKMRDLVDVDPRGVDRDSGGNVIYLIPSIWLSNQKFMFQTGVGFPVGKQKLNGSQIKNRFLVAANFGWGF